MAICLDALYHTILSIARGTIKKIFTRPGEEFLGARLIFQMPRMSQNSAGLTTKSTGG